MPEENKNFSRNYTIGVATKHHYTSGDDGTD